MYIVTSSKDGTPGFDPKVISVFDKDMILLNNAFPKTEFQAIKGLICSDSFPWFYTGTAYPNEVAGLEQYSWAHVAKNIDGWTSFICKPLEAMILNALGQVDEPVKNIIRIRLGLVSVTSQPVIHVPHIDLTQPHKTGLLYINDSDGDTILYNEMYDPSLGLDVYTYYKDVLKEHLTIHNNIRPTENTLICFEGYRYHSSTSPVKQSRRIVLNFNYE